MKSLILAAVAAVVLNTTLAAQVPEDGKDRSVTDELSEFDRRSSEGLPPEIVEAGKKGNEELLRSGILERALNVGGTMPAFELPDATGSSVTSSELLSKGPIVIVFYRGAWCPFCNIYLRGLQKRLSEIEALGASLVAISVEPPDRSLEVVKKNELAFTVLSDPGLVAARKFGIVYRVPKVVDEAVKGLGLDIAKYNGTEIAELPLGATYVVDGNGKVVYAFLEIDYKKRADPEAVLAAIKGIR